LTFIEERDVLLSDWEYVHGLDPYSCLHSHVLLYSRGSMIHYHYIKGILGTLICYTLGYSFPQKVFGVLAVFNEAQVRGIVYINFREPFRSLPFTVVVGMRIEGECWI
jgi:hypothetical protein